MSTRIYHKPIPPSQPTVQKDVLDPLRAALAPALVDLPRLPRQERSRKKRDGLLNAAAQVFAEHSYAATTADAIADLAGVSIGTFYNYFRNKRQILLALIVARCDDIFERLRLTQLDLSGGHARARIRTAVAAALREGEQSGLRRVWQVLMSAEPDLLPYQGAIRDYAQRRLAEQLRQAQRRGGTWDHLDVEVMAGVILALIDTLSARPLRHMGEERVIDGVTDMILHAIYCSPT